MARSSSGDMDAPLLEGGGTTSSRRSVKTSNKPSRFDAIAKGKPYQKAAALVDLAEDGIGLPEEILDLPSIESHTKLYLIFIRFDIIWTLNIFALIALNFFEKPLWCSSVSEVTCSDRDYYFLGELPYLNNAESLTFESVTLIILGVHTLFPLLYEGFSLYWKSHVNKIKAISLLILAADLVVDILYLSRVAIYSLPLRIAPYIRVVFFILNIRDLRDSFVVFGAIMVRKYLYILALWLLFLLFSSWLAYVIFEDTIQGTTLFVSYPATLYQMFVLFTTSNNPDVWIPAYKLSRWSSVFFVLYVLLSVYFVTNLILAVVYDSFREELYNQFCMKDKMRKRILKRAFDLIKDDHVPNQQHDPNQQHVPNQQHDPNQQHVPNQQHDPNQQNVDYLDKGQCISLFKELNAYRTLPKISEDKFSEIFEELDSSHDFKIDLEEFNDLCNAIALEIQKEDTEPWLKKFPFYDSSLSENLKTFVKSTTFRYVVPFVLLLNLVTVITETTLDIQNNSGQKFWQKVEFVFGWIYVLEMALKVYTYGFENYWKDRQNRFDFIVTWVIVIGETATFVSPTEQTFLSNGEWIRYLLIARILRLIRLLLHVKEHRTFVATFLNLIHSLMPYLGTIFCVMSIYCTLGIQVFGGLVNAGNSDLPSTEMADSDYLLFNFNDYPNGMVTLFNLIVMGISQVWMEDYAKLTGTAWTYAYFVSYYLITVLLLLELIVAFVLEAFSKELEFELRQDEKENKGTKTRGGHRNMGTKTHSQRVEKIIRRIFPTSALTPAT